MLVETFKELEEPNGMKNTLYQVYGNSINQAEYPMDPTGIFGAQSKK
jgi:hypothetical protein